MLKTIVPSLDMDVEVVVATSVPEDVEAEAIFVSADGDVPEVLGLSREALQRAGFSGAVGSTLAAPVPSGPVLVATGYGKVDTLNPAVARDVASHFARAVPKDSNVAFALPAGLPFCVCKAASAVIEGMLLSRHRYSRKTGDAPEVQIKKITLVVSEEDVEKATKGAKKGLKRAQIALFARDLATCPAVDLTPVAFAEVAEAVAADAGLTVESYGKAELEEMGCGGLLGVNRGSAREPRMIVVNYRPENPTGKLALVGKGITFDGGGLSIKPGDESHSQMKNDMTGAGDVLAAMWGLKDLGCTTEVTGYLMCTDNMVSGTAMQLGDVITIRGGKTVEVLNTDAEGRLVMADGVALAAETDVDAIINIATLTGACLRALGTRIAGVMGTSEALIDQIEAAGERTDENVWEFPLPEFMRSQLDSDVADLKNIASSPNAGQITAALFMKEFNGGKPWAHIDIAGTAQSPAEDRWLRRGPTGFGARLLAEVACKFEVPAE